MGGMLYVHLNLSQRFANHLVSLAIHQARIQRGAKGAALTPRSPPPLDLHLMKCLTN